MQREKLIFLYVVNKTSILCQVLFWMILRHSETTDRNLEKVLRWSRQICTNDFIRCLRRCRRCCPMFLWCPTVMRFRAC